MAKLDFPAASASPFLAPNGVTYTYIGTEPNGHWSGTEADGTTSLESKFVEIAGDDMSGDLTLGTNKIKLDATTGAGTFAGATHINSEADAVGPGLIVSCEPIVAPELGGWIRLADSVTGIARSQWGYNVGVNDVTFDLVGAGTGLRIRNSDSNLTSASDLVTLSADGSAEFAGGATVAGGSEIRVGSGSAAYVVNDGFGTGIYAGSAINLRSAANALTVDIKSADGSAEFAGDLKIGENAGAGGDPGVRVTAGGGMFSNVNSGSDFLYSGSIAGDNKAKIFFKGDGSATFNGTVFSPYFSFPAGPNAFMTFDAGTNQLALRNSSQGVALNVNATSWTSYSQRSLKTSLTSIEDGLNKVATLSACIGRYKTDDPSISRSFLIADEVKDVLPEAVYGEGTLRSPLNLAYTEVIPLLVSALHDTKARIEALEAEVQSLKEGN
jgi:hypothetical protein